MIFPRRSKYRAVPTVVAGQRYASKAEARYAASLSLRKAAGEVLDWLEQVPIRLPGGIKYVCDFMLLMRDGSVRFVEVKGMETPVWKMKRKLLAESRPDIASRLEVVK